MKRFSDTANASDCAFTKREKHPYRWWGPLLITLVPNAIAVVVVTGFLVFTDAETLLSVIDPPYLWVLLGMFLLFLILDRTTPKLTAVYQDGRFIVFFGQKVRFSFLAEDVRKIELEEFNKSITFYLPRPPQAGKKQKNKLKGHKLVLVGFSRKDRREIIAKVWCILDLP